MNFLSSYAAPNYWDLIYKWQMKQTSILICSLSQTRNWNGYNGTVVNMINKTFGFAVVNKINNDTFSFENTLIT